MEPSCLNDDVEYRLPREFLTDDDYKLFKGVESNLLPYDPIDHGFGLDSGFDRTVNQTGDDEESFLTGSTRRIAQSSSLEDGFSGGFRGNHAFPADNNYQAWGATRSPPCGTGDGYRRRNHNCHTRVSSQAAAWDLYCAAAVEELAAMNISGGYNSCRGIVDLPRKHPLASAAAAAVKNPNDNGAGGYYYSRQSLQYQQKLQALQLMQQSRGVKANNNNNKIATQSPSVWCNQPQRSYGSGMRAVFLRGDRTGKLSRSTGTGVFLPRRVNPETREKPSIATVLIPARVAEVLNLDESVVQPSVRSSASSLNEPSWRQKSYYSGGFSSQMKMEQTVIEPRLPSDWAY